MNDPPNVCITEAAHRLALGEWGVGADRYAELTRWLHDDAEGERLFGSRRAAEYVGERGRRLFASMAPDGSMFGESLWPSSSIAREMLAATGLSPMELQQALDEHYRPKLVWLIERKARLWELGFLPLLQRIADRTIVAYGRLGPGELRSLPPISFAAVVALDPASPQVAFRSDPYDPARNVLPRILRDDVQRIAGGGENSCAAEAQKSRRTQPVERLVEKWAETYLAENGHFPGRRACRKKADDHNWSQSALGAIIRSLADTRKVPTSPPGRRRVKPRPS